MEGRGSGRTDWTVPARPFFTFGSFEARYASNCVPVSRSASGPYRRKARLARRAFLVSTHHLSHGPANATEGQVTSENPAGAITIPSRPSLQPTREGGSNTD